MVVPPSPPYDIPLMDIENTDRRKGKARTKRED
jgi:hypothetical protein